MGDVRMVVAFVANGHVPWGTPMVHLPEDGQRPSWGAPVGLRGWLVPDASGDGRVWAPEPGQQPADSLHLPSAAWGVLVWAADGTGMRPAAEHEAACTNAMAMAAGGGRVVQLERGSRAHPAAAHPAAACGFGSGDYREAGRMPEGVRFEFRTIGQIPNTKPGEYGDVLNREIARRLEREQYEIARLEGNVRARAIGACVAVRGASCFAWIRDGACQHVDEGRWLGRKPGPGEAILLPGETTTG